MEDTVKDMQRRISQLESVVNALALMKSSTRRLSWDDATAVIEKAAREPLA